MPRFVVQLHDATTLHYDLRLELGGVMRSWAVPKGPSMDPAVKRLAVAVADHAVQDVPFEGVYEDAARGSGAVIVWDEGEFELLREQPGHLVVELDGHKLAGGFALTRTGELRVDPREDGRRSRAARLRHRPRPAAERPQRADLAGARGRLSGGRTRTSGTLGGRGFRVPPSVPVRQRSVSAGRSARSRFSGGSVACRAVSR